MAATALEQDGAADTASAALLAINNIEVVYDHVILALKGVSFEIPKGGVTALLGANGAGKTTVLRSILGLTRPRRGDICFQGKSIAARPTHEIAQAGIGWVPDDRRLCPTLTVAKNLSLGI
jgi:branched-chain amino acid transport system ATP-binding protein